MYCRHCGTQVEDTDRVCKNCGRLTEYGEKLKREADAAAFFAAAFAAQAARAENPEEKAEDGKGEEKTEGKESAPASRAINPDGSLNIEEYERERATRRGDFVSDGGESKVGGGYYFAPEKVTPPTDREKPGKNNVAIVGFILAFLLPVAGIIVSAVGLIKSAQTHSGKGLSIAGIILSVVLLFCRLYR